MYNIVESRQAECAATSVTKIVRTALSLNLSDRGDKIRIPIAGKFDVDRIFAGFGIRILRVDNTG